MKELIFSYLLLHVISFTMAQDNLGNRKITDVSSGTLLYIPQYTDIQGSPFLFEEWVHGKVILNNEAVIDKISLKFDIYSNKFVVNRENIVYEISPAIKEIRLYPVADSSSVMVFRKGFAINPKINQNKYLQVLSEGKVSLLKYIKKDLEEYNEYGNATKFKRFNERSEYYLLLNNEYKSVSLTKKNLQDILSDKWSSVYTFMEQQHLNGKDEKSWAACIIYYNKL